MTARGWRPGKAGRGTSGAAERPVVVAQVMVVVLPEGERLDARLGLDRLPCSPSISVTMRPTWKVHFELYENHTVWAFNRKALSQLAEQVDIVALRPAVPVLAVVESDVVRRVREQGVHGLQGLEHFQAVAVVEVVSHTRKIIQLPRDKRCCGSCVTVTGAVACS